MFGQVFAAMDGMNWTPKQGLNSSSTLWEVEWDDPSGEWYAVGDGGSVFASSTAANWTTVTFPGSGQLRGLTTTGSDWFVVGDNGKLARSAVGTGAWNAVTVPVSTLLNDVEFNGSQFVAVGDPSGPNSVVMTSGNGNQWTPQAISTSNPLRGLAWTGTEWIVVGDASAIFTSPDGQQWTQQSTGLGTTTHDLHQVASK
jgi:hypothetical protein